MHLEGIDLKKFPKTNALSIQKSISSSDVEKFWEDRLYDGSTISDQDNWKNEIHPNEANLVTKNLSHVLQSFSYEKHTILKGGWRPAKGESLIRFLYNRFYSFYLR